MMQPLSLAISMTYRPLSKTIYVMPTMWGPQTIDNNAKWDLQSCSGFVLTTAHILFAKSYLVVHPLLFNYFRMYVSLYDETLVS